MSEHTDSGLCNCPPCVRERKAKVTIRPKQPPVVHEIANAYARMTHAGWIARQCAEGPDAFGEDSPEYRDARREIEKRKAEWSFARSKARSLGVSIP